jgi:hypothetical protein
MKISIKILCSILILLSQTSRTFAQGELKGKISDYNSGPAQIVSFDRFSGTSHTWSDVNSAGEFSIFLEHDFLNKVKKMAEEAEKKAPDGFKISFRTVAETFACTYEEVGSEGGDVVVSGLPELSITDENGNPSNGILYAASSQDIATWLYTYGDGLTNPGYYLQFYYLDGPAKAKGDCLLETFTGNEDESYEEITSIDLDLQEGWNIIKYEIEAVFTTSEGKVYPSRLTISRLDKLPDDLQWFAVKD